jgi:hypothetical protein
MGFACFELCNIFAARWYTIVARTNHVTTYLALFFGLLVACIAVFGRRLSGGAIEVGAWAVGGHCIAILAVSLSQFMDSRAGALSNSFRTLGVWQVVAAYVVLTLPLAGWFFGPALMLSTRWVVRRMFTGVAQTSSNADLPQRT